MVSNKRKQNKINNTMLGSVKGKFMQIRKNRARFVHTCSFIFLSMK